MATPQAAGGGAAHAEALQALLGSLMSQAFGNQTVPLLRTVLAGKTPNVVNPRTSVRDAGLKIAEHRKAALVVDPNDGHLLGIFDFKDIMTRAVAKDLPLDLSTVAEVMTPNPEHVSPETTVLEALQIMHDHHVSTLPVCEDDGRVVGLVDVMDVIHGCGGADGWRSIFRQAMEIDDGGTIMQQPSVIEPSVRGAPAITAAAAVVKKDPVIRVGQDSNFGANIPANIPVTVEFGDDALSMNDSFINSRSGFADRSTDQFDGADAVIFKVTDPNSNIHRVRCVPRLSTLCKMVAGKIGGGTDPSSLQIQFVDDEGDIVLVTTDEDLGEAVSISKASGQKAVKIKVVFGKNGLSAMLEDPVMLGIAGAVVVGVVVLGFVLSRR